MPAGKRPLVLIIRDGWGENPHPEHDAFNAAKLARTPVDAMLRRDWPWTLIKTSGEDVGLPDGTMGNSEVGHQNIGAGRIVEQESRTITRACAAGFHAIPAVRDAVSAARDSGRAVHLLGINSDAGVHGLLEHLYAFVRACKSLGQSRVYVHLFADGRDTGPFTGRAYAAQVQAELDRIGAGRIASVIGRYYAMDRDHRWERVARAWACLTGRGAAAHNVQSAANADAAFGLAYEHPADPGRAGDEFIEPTMIGADAEARCASRIAPGDTVIFYNYRGDRPRELSSAFVFPDERWAAVKPSPDSGLRGFDRGGYLPTRYLIMTEYWDALLPFCGVVFPKPPRMPLIAGETISRAGLRQFRCAETEKYPHVTFFFNDYREEPFPGEVRNNPQSPRVATYDLAPEMSAALVRDATIARLRDASCEDLLVVNFANADMVGHTGNLAAAIKACESVDACVGEIIRAALARGGALIITADHGNCEQMFDPATNAPHTAHTAYDVPLFVVGEGLQGRRLRGDNAAANWFNPAARAARGRLADIIPTGLEIMDVPQPAEMTGRSLLVR